MKINENILRKLIRNGNYYAHTRSYDTVKETLYEHSETTFKYFKKIMSEKQLNPVFDRIYADLFGEENKFKELFYDLIEDAVYLHDLGKINPEFQTNKMDNPIRHEREFVNSNHSEYSSMLYECYYIKRAFDEYDIPEVDLTEENIKNYTILILLIIINGTLMNGHHSSLNSYKKSLEHFTAKVRNLSNKYFTSLFSEDFKYLNLSEDDMDVLENYVSEASNLSNETSIVIYTYSRLLFGLIIHSDILATVEFTDLYETEDLGLIKNVEIFRDCFEKSSINQNIRKYSSGKLEFNKNDINKLRTEMFLEAENNLLSYESECDQNFIYQLEAPTGAGKTNISINTVINLLQQNKELNKVFYAFPFNTLVEQTYDSLNNVFGNDKDVMKNFRIFNSVNSFENLFDNNSEEEEIEYSKMFREYQFLYSPFAISTNVKLFDIFFGNKKTSYYAFPLLANSVIVLDEIQAYKNSIWAQISQMLFYYSKILNIKILIMSATLPNLRDLLAGKSIDYSPKSLIKDRERYFKNELFKSRVQLDFELFNKDYSESEEVFQEILDNIIKREKKLVLVEFIFNKRAKEFYNFIFNSVGDAYEVRLITGSTNRKKRKNIINLVKERKEQILRNEEVKGIVLVATQVIEAGVDLDVQDGYKNVSLLDAEEQFLGRINRNFKFNDSKAYFFKIDDPNKLYKNDVRAQKNNTIENTDNRDYLLNKNFNDFYTARIIPEINENNKQSRIGRGDDIFKKSMSSLDYKQLEEFFRLIDDKEKYIWFLCEDSNRKEEYISLWQEYKNIIQDIKNFSERKVKLMEIRNRMDEFIYESTVRPEFYNDFVGGMFLIEDSEEYFLNGEFYPMKKEVEFI